MDQQAWERLQPIFFAALELPPESRDAYLDEACEGDEHLRQEVAAVLAGHDRARAGRAHRGETLATGEAATANGSGRHTGQHIGPYLLGERIGRGGMGEVYRAERVDEQYRQQVAIKLVRSVLLDDEMERRFRVERQVLARLQHPNVATLLDGGVTEDGSPYLVMQYVDGVPITEYADANRLSIGDRLRLLATVCRAVQFAHSNLVVHRDLKPSNILVTAAGEVRLLDFGIAKLLDPESAGITVPLTEGRLLLTPEHAAPEQIQGEPITTATDVYALGVLLYELLSGARPFHGLAGRELHRAVCELEPPRPSAAVLTPSPDRRDLGAAPVARARGTHLNGLLQELRGDLDQIVLMALRKEPERRYASAQQLADDIERYLEGRPVVARRATWRYRTQKFMRRNRLAVAAVATVLFLLSGATLVTASQARARAVALEEAQAERARAETLASFLLSIFRANEPATALGRSITARELLDQAASRVESELADQPLVQADMKLAIGRAYGSLGFVEPSVVLFEDVLRTRREHLPDDSARIGEALNQLGRGYAAQGDLTRAVPVMREALDVRERVLGPRDTAVAATLTMLARMEIDLGEVGEARQRLERAVAIYREQAEPNGRELANSLRFLALAHQWMNNQADELRTAKEALDVGRTSLHANDPMLLNVMEDYALALVGSSQLDSAAAVTQDVLERRVQLYGEEHVDLSFSYFNMGQILASMGRHGDAADAFLRSLQIRERTLGADHLLTSHAMVDYADALAEAGEPGAAVELAERGSRIREEVLGPEHDLTFQSLEVIARIQARLGRLEDSMATLEVLVARGWVRWAELDHPAFDPLRTDDRFGKLVERSDG